MTQPEGDEPEAVLERLRKENRKLAKINRVLIDRVERSTDAQGNAFSIFQAAITLEKMVQERTGELQALAARLRREIAERTAIEAALENAKTEAERANLGKTHFLAAASHDLLQPLNIARLFLDVLHQRDRDDEDRRLIARVRGALDGAERLLETLLDMSRFDAGAMTAEVINFPLDELLHRLGEEYELQAEERELRFRVMPTDAIVRTDPQLLERVLRNLIGNAFRYTERGGVLVGTRRRGQRLRIEVWDTGAGIPAERLEEIFEEFKQLEQPGHTKQGLGLGLSIVERIAKLLDLPIEVRSRVGRGSVFSVGVPLAYAVSEGLRRVQERRANTLDGKTILVIDDDRDALEGLVNVLRGWGCATIEAASAAAALGACQLARRPDFIVADFHLERGRTGLDAIERVRNAFDAPISAAVISADLSADVRGRVTASGHWFLSKPVRIERLRSLLGSVFA